MRVFLYSISLLLGLLPYWAQAESCLSAAQVHQNFSQFATHASWKTAPGYHANATAKHLTFQYGLWVQNRIICHYSYQDHNHTSYFAIVYKAPVQQTENLSGTWRKTPYYTYNPNMKICRNSSAQNCQFSAS